MIATHFRSAKQLASDIRRGKIGALEALDLFLARVDRFNPQLNAIVASDTEAARRRARQADAALRKGKVWGPLHGVPMTVKESYDVAGMPTTWGLSELKDNVPTRHALAVDRLLGAGVVLFGKTNVPSWLADWQSFNPVYGTTNNPWDLTRTPGGSSGGSAAALAAGLTGLEAGSDIGSSIRNPAHYCGVYGHKPTYGIVPPRGQALPGRVAQGDISVIGPMGRSADDLALGLSVMAGADEIDGAGWRLELPAPRQKKLRDFKVAVMLTDPVSEVDAEVQARVQAVAEFLAQAEGQGQRHRAARHRHRGGAARLRLSPARGHRGPADVRGVRAERGDRARPPPGRRELLRADDARERAARIATGWAPTRRGTRCAGAGPSSSASTICCCARPRRARPSRTTRKASATSGPSRQRPPRAYHRPALLGRLSGDGLPALDGGARRVLARGPADRRADRRPAVR